jgi:hypothetical protein
VTTPAIGSLNGQPAFSNPSATLTPTSNGPDQGVTDSAGDQPASSSNVPDLHARLAACTGQSLAGRALPLAITARTPRGENAATTVWVRFAA